MATTTTTKQQPTQKKVGYIYDDDTMWIWAERTLNTDTEQPMLSFYCLA